MKYEYKNMDKLTNDEKELLKLLDEMPEVNFIFWKRGEGGYGEER